MPTARRKQPCAKRHCVQTMGGWMHAPLEAEVCHPKSHQGAASGGGEVQLNTLWYSEVVVEVAGGWKVKIDSSPVVGNCVCATIPSASVWKLVLKGWPGHAGQTWTPDGGIRAVGEELGFNRMVGWGIRAVGEELGFNRMVRWGIRAVGEELGFNRMVRWGIRAVGEELCFNRMVGWGIRAVGEELGFNRMVSWGIRAVGEVLGFNRMVGWGIRAVGEVLGFNMMVSWGIRAVGEELGFNRMVSWGTAAAGGDVAALEKVAL
eukprot:364090-Chlamydomonas_euryale.AAC.2